MAFVASSSMCVLLSDTVIYSYRNLDLLRGFNGQFTSETGAEKCGGNPQCNPNTYPLRTSTSTHQQLLPSSCSQAVTVHDSDNISILQSKQLRVVAASLRSTLRTTAYASSEQAGDVKKDGITEEELLSIQTAQSKKRTEKVLELPQIAQGVAVQHCQGINSRKLPHNIMGLRQESHRYVMAQSH
ncbi:hypothetical protein BKA93DRAFT_753392 [Sparassis latifolia]